MEPEKYLEHQICPICNFKIQKSDYLKEIFGDNPKVEWIANLVTHYRHSHISSWNKCWGYNGRYYRSGWFGNYDEEKILVNERAKRQLIRKGFEIFKSNGVTSEHFKVLQNTTEETIKLAEKLLDSSEVKVKKKKKAI